MTQVQYFERNDSRTSQYIFVACLKNGGVSLIAETPTQRMVQPIVSGITEHTDYENIFVIQGKSAWKKIGEFIEGNVPKGYKQVSSI